MGVDRNTGEITSDAFLAALKELRHGAAIVDLSDALTELVQAVRLTGRKGSLLLTLTVAPAAKGEINALLLQDDLKIKAPRSERGATILFADNDGMLTRKDPRQPELLGLVKATVTPIVLRDGKEAAGGE